MNKFSDGLIAALMGGIIRALNPEAIKVGIDAFLDAIENYVAKTENKVDDKIVLPAISALRAAINVPDGENG